MLPLWSGVSLCRKSSHQEQTERRARGGGGGEARGGQQKFRRTSPPAGQCKHSSHRDFRMWRLSMGGGEGRYGTHNAPDSRSHAGTPGRTLTPVTHKRAEELPASGACDLPERMEVSGFRKRGRGRRSPASSAESRVCAEMRSSLSFRGIQRPHA